MRIGFLGTGWIGRHRMQMIAESGLLTNAFVADPSADMVEAARKTFPGAVACAGIDEMLARELDGIVIATPSALHADQSIRALEHGVPVFCQKPLGRTEAEVARVVEAARARDLLLGVDLSYRGTRGMRQIHELVSGGAIGDVFAIDLTFHNAYGPDKPWFYDPVQSGGGCVMDLGVHLVDLALWTLGFPAITDVTSRLFSAGRALADPSMHVEDYAVARLDIEGGTSIQLQCSWKVSAGQDAVIAARFYGTKGGLSFENVGGSFYDFVARHHRGTQSETLAGPPDAWGGVQAVEWAQRLSRSKSFDPSAENLIVVARALDAIYGRESGPGAAHRDRPVSHSRT